MHDITRDLDSRETTDWVSVDVLAGLYAQGILAEHFRWAELEQLVYSADRWERRLVGSTVANVPHGLPRRAVRSWLVLPV